MSIGEGNLSKGKHNEEQIKETISLYSINQRKEDILNLLNKEIKKKSKTQEKENEKNNINKEAAGYKIGQYLIKKTIGKGSFGKVKLAIYLPNKEKIAIKIVDKKRIIEKDDLIRIKREFEMLSKFDHPNIILIAEIFETEERYYTVMEYCENGELFNYIVKKRYLCEEEAAFFFYQLICGLEYIHSLGIVHRDLKPENLLLTKNNLLKIIDFGLSHYHNANSDNLLSTPCGSPCYASPEMVSGSRYDGYKIDIWSCGVILFAMLCGYLPFEHKNNTILFQKILECKIKLPHYLSRDSRDLILKILVKDPKKRITIEQIKKHPFYLKGKNIFNNNYEIEQINFKDGGQKIEKYEKTKNIEKEKEKENIQINEINKNKASILENNNNKNEKILIIESNNQNNDDDNNKKINNQNNINTFIYQPILTDYGNKESKIKRRKKEKKLEKKVNSKKNSTNNNKTVGLSGVKSIKNRSSNNTKEHFNIAELLKLNIFNHKTKKTLQNKKSHKVISSKNLSSGNLTKKINSLLNYNKNTYKSNAYEVAVIHTDTNSKKKESSKKYLNKRISSNAKKQRIIIDNDNLSYKSRLLTDAGINNINGKHSMHNKINNIKKINKKGFNYIKIMKKNSNIIKNVNKGNLINNIFDKYIHKIIDKKKDIISNNSKKSKQNSKSKKKVIKLMKQSDNMKEDNKKKINNFIFNKNNAGLIDSDYSSYILKTEPNQYLNKLSNNNNINNNINNNNNMLLNDIIKNINTPAPKKNHNNITNKRKNNLPIVKQKSIPTLSDLSDYIYKNNNIKNYLTNKNKKKNIINTNFINKQRVHNISKKNKTKKNTQNNSLTKKNTFFTIRNSMINLNIHTPALIISSYNKKGMIDKKNKNKIKYSDIENHEHNDSISSNKNRKNLKEIKGKNKFIFNSVKTGFNLTTKKLKNKMEYEQINKQLTINKNISIKYKFSNTKVGNIIKDNNNKYNNYQDKKNVLKKQLNLNNNIITGKIENKKVNKNFYYNYNTIKSNKK